MPAGGFVLNRIVVRPFEPTRPLERPEKGRDFAGTELDVDALEVDKQVADEFSLRW
ncbi:hypothetical protein HYG81_00040 [Natrinema zhouii]|uniref:Uncharacterized protein n=1 Tax=Natrinema zhouii TaxID=1710539 RepID=A0A7D6GRK4_9EURY|nr:hypothetical protein [Natrinema zhouii]QLK26063.1 hypothetical protein HYG81_00040 [Natrinema zhouii]